MRKRPGPLHDERLRADITLPRVVSATFVMTRDTTGKVAGLLLRQGGQDLSARKVR